MQDTADLAARMRLWGLSRREAAEEVCLSYSAFNRKLRENRLSENERERLQKLLEGRMFPRGLGKTAPENARRREGGRETTGG